MSENVKKVKGHLSFSDVFEDATKHCRKIPASNYLESGIYQIIDQGQNNIAGYTNDSIDLYTDTPVIIFGDHTRVVKYIDKPFFIGADGVKVLKPKTNELNTKYLYYVLSNAKIPNTGYNRHFKWLKEIKIPVFSFSMQEEIVSLLNKIETIIDKRKQQLENLDKLIKSQFIEMFGDPERNEMGWNIVPLSQIAEYFNGLTYRPEDRDDKGTIVLRSSNIQQGELDFSDIVRVQCRVKEKLFVKNGDILMCSRNGSANLVGKVAQIPQLSEPMTFGAFMMIIRSQVPEYLTTYFRLNTFRNQIKTGATTTINQITAAMLNKVRLPLPPRTITDKFARFVEQTDKSKFTIKQSLEQLEILKKSLMQKYFG